MTTIKYSNFRQICRTCLMQKDNMLPLQKFNIPEMLANFTSIKIELEDDLPFLVCSECLNQIKNCYSFKQQCEKNNRLLQQVRLENAYNLFHSVYCTETNDKDNFIKKGTTDTLNEQMKDSIEPDYSDANCYPEFMLEQDSTEKSFQSNPNELSENDSQSQNNNDKSKQKELECKICNKVLTAAHSFARHMQMHNRDKESTYKCSICQEYYEKRHVIQHTQRHETEERSCESCGDKFVELAAYAEHMKNHNTTLLSCKKCDRQFVLRLQLEIHMMKAHLKKLNNECTVCGKLFSSRSTLQKHKVTHSSDRPFSCELCDSKFKDSNTLNIHVKCVHRGIKQNERQLCKICGASVTRLQLHIWAKHSKEKPFNCEQCEASFVAKSLLNIHVRSKHKGEEVSNVLCNVCGKRWRSKSELNIHMRIHTKERPYNCPTCEKGFATISALNCHVRTHTGERPYSCTTCGKSFGSSNVLKNHKRIHTGEKPYGCNVCEKSFRQRCALVTHMKIH